MPAILAGNSEEVRRMAMWAAAAVAMFLVVAGWVWSFQVSVPQVQNAADQPFAELNTNLSSLFTDANSALSTLKAGVNERDGLGASDTAPVVDPAVIELLKEKVQQPSMPSAALPTQAPKK